MRELSFGLKAISRPNEQGQTRSEFVSCSLQPAIVHNVLLKILRAGVLYSFLEKMLSRRKVENIFSRVRKIFSCLEKTVISPAASTSLTKTAGAVAAWPQSQSRDLGLTNHRRDLGPTANQGPESCQEAGPRKKKPEM